MLWRGFIWLKCGLFPVFAAHSWQSCAVYTVLHRDIVSAGHRRKQHKTRFRVAVQPILVPRGLRRGFAAARLPGLRVRIPPGA